MSTITRTWLAFAAIGTGLIHVALVVGSPVALGIIFAIVGLAEFGWGVLTFAREDVALPRLVMAAALAPLLAWGLLLVTSTAAESPAIAQSLPVFPLAVATLFELFIAVTIALHLRRQSEHRPASPALGVRGRLIGLVAGGVLVAALTTPALAATRAGNYGGQTGGVFDLPHQH